MRLARPFVLSAVALAVAGAAYAERPAAHAAAYQLPDGGVALVRYSGDVAPRLIVVGDPAAGEMASPFAALDRIAEMMEAQADAMFAQVTRMQQVTAVSPTGAVLANAPAGVHWTSISRRVTDGKVCTSEISMVSGGAGRAPTTVHKVSGDCGGAAATPKPPAPPAAIPRDSI